MKRLFSCFVLVVLFAVPVSFGFNAKSGTSSLRQDAKDVYQQHCARCHGADGKSKTALGKTFKAPDLTTTKVQKRSDSRFTQSIKNGRGNMPKFSKKLSAEDIIALVAYVRSLKK